MNKYQRNLRDFQDYTEDVLRSRYQTFDDAIRRLASTIANSTPLGEVVAQLPKVDFDEWYKERLETVGGMVGSGDLTWPEDRLERLAMQVEMMKHMGSGKLNILDFSHNFLYTGSRFDDNIAEFVSQIFRPFARDFLRFAHEVPSFSNGLNQHESLHERNAQMNEELTLFVSHSGRDEKIAKALVTLFEKALKISARRIRCTSVNGYRLPAGVETNDRLRTEVFESKLFIALLTPNSLKSLFVLFELGARWGTRKPLFPILAGGTTPDDLKPPLNGLNALSASVGDHVRQLIENAAEALSERLEPISSFSTEVEAVVTASRKVIPHNSN